MSVTELNQPTTFAGLSTRVEEVIENAYWNFDNRKKRREMPQSERDAFKWAVRDMLLKLRQPDNGPAGNTP